MNLTNYIEQQYIEINERKFLNPEFFDLYDTTENERLKNIFSSLHKQFVVLFKQMNDRLPTGEYPAHFWAEQSRDLIKVIEISLGLYRSLKNSEHSFEIDNYKLELMKHCQSFLKSSGGSTLPPKMEKINLYYTVPIFTPSSIIKISRGSTEACHKLTMIGEGSYAHVYKYKDEFYDRHFALKRAKKSLSPTEIARFKREFEELRNLRSPYIVDVFSFDETKNEYIMEYVDFSLEKFMELNNGKITPDLRMNIGLQILKVFSYLHSKNRVHRDVSSNNVLIKQYEDVVVVKVSDFGLVKIPESTLTSHSTELKGRFNDPALAIEGFENYGVVHETYALTRLLLYILTGKTNPYSIKDPKINRFVQKGLNADKSKRFQTVAEINDAFKHYFKA